MAHVRGDEARKPSPREMAPAGRTADLSADELQKMDAYWRAANYLSVGQIYLYDNPLLEEAADQGAHQAAAARTLGHDAGSQLHLRPPQPGHQEVRPRRDLRRRARATADPALVANTYLEGTYSEVYPEHLPGRGGDEAALHPVLVSRRHSEPRRARDARLDPRGRRARLRAVARVRRRLRQPRPARRLRRRRRRGRDRAAGHELALQQVPQSGDRRRGAADPASERLQDRQSVPCSPASATRSSITCSAATATRRTSSRATIRRRCTS